MLRSQIALVACVLFFACGPPEVTDYDREKADRLCARKATASDKKFEKRVRKAFDSDVSKRVVRICAQGGKDTARYYQVATTTIRTDYKVREAICDQIRKKIKRAKIEVHCESLNCKTVCGGA